MSFGSFPKIAGSMSSDQKLSDDIKGFVGLNIRKKNLQQLGKAIAQ